ncbi:MAG: RNA polymerase sigma factor [Bacteroidota bacterium]
MKPTLQASIEACKSGNRAAFQVIYETFLNYAYTLCTRYEVPSSDCRDVLQEIFAEVYLSLSKYDASKGAFQYWLRTLAVRTIFAYWKKRKRHNFQSLTLDATTSERWSVELDTRDLDKEHLVKEINALPVGYRTVLNLFVIDGYSHKEIAQLLNIKEASSRSQLARALRQLKSILQKKYKLYETIG